MTDTKIVVNCETGETSVLTLTSEEIAQREADAAAFATAEAERQKALKPRTVTTRKAPLPKASAAQGR